MTYTSERNKRERSREPHPIWRGIGLIMIIGVPFLSFGIAQEVLAIFAQNGIAIPPEMQRPPQVIPGLGIVVTDWPAVLAFAILTAVILFGFFAVINAIIYGSSKANTYRAFESKPKRYKKKRKLVKPDYE